MEGRDLALPTTVATVDPRLLRRNTHVSATHMSYDATKQHGHHHQHHHHHHHHEDAEDKKMNACSDVSKPTMFVKVGEDDLTALASKMTQLMLQNKKHVIDKCDSKDGCGAGGCTMERTSRDVRMREVVYKDKKLVEEIIIHKPVCETTWRTYHVMQAPTVINIGEPKVCPKQLGDFKRTACHPPIFKITHREADNLMKITNPEDAFAQYRTAPASWPMEKRMEYANLLAQIPVELRSRAPHFTYFYPEPLDSNTRSHFADAEDSSFEMMDNGKPPRTMAQPSNFWEAIKLNFTADIPDNVLQSYARSPERIAYENQIDASNTNMMTTDEIEQNMMIRRELAAADAMALKQSQMQTMQAARV